MLFLVLSYRDNIRIVNEDVGGHQDGVRKQTMGSDETARDLVFVGVAAFEQTHGRDSAENPGEFGVLRNITLPKENAFFGIEATGEKVDGEVSDMTSKQLAILNGCQGMIIGDEVVGVALVLQAQGRVHHTKIIADVESPAGLEAGKDTHKPEVMGRGRRQVKPTPHEAGALSSGQPQDPLRQLRCGEGSQAQDLRPS